MSAAEVTFDFHIELKKRSSLATVLVLLLDKIAKL